MKIHSPRHIEHAGKPAAPTLCGRVARIRMRGEAPTCKTCRRLIGELPMRDPEAPAEPRWRMSCP